MSELKWLARGLLQMAIIVVVAVVGLALFA